MKNKNLKVLLASAVAALLMACTPATTQKSQGVQPVERVAFEDQKKIDELTQTGIYYYWHGGDLKKVEEEFFKGITLKGKYDVVENSFKEASELDPGRLDLRFSVASTQIIQKKVEEALTTYDEILKLYPGSFEANILSAVYSDILGDNETYVDKMEFLGKTYPQLTKEYIEKFNRTEEYLKTPINIEAQKIDSENHAIVILGYALSDEGEMKAPLIGRLEQGLAAAKLNPESEIIVSGGVPKAGVTEAYLMKKWFVEKGISPERVHMDDQAKDTVGNAIYSSMILKEIGAEDVTLITSASHIRRGLSVFKEASLNEGMDIEFTNLVYLDYDSIEEAQKVSQSEHLVVYRDLMRTSGIWAYPGIQR